MQPGAQRDFVKCVAAVFTNESGGGNQAGDFAHAGALVGSTATTGQARHKLALAFEFHIAAELQADKGIQIEVAALARHEVQRIGCLQCEAILKQRVDAFAAFELEGHQRGLAGHDRDGGTVDGKGARGVEQTRHTNSISCTASQVKRLGKKQKGI